MNLSNHPRVFWRSSSMPPRISSLPSDRLISCASPKTTTTSNCLTRSRSKGDRFISSFYRPTRTNAVQVNQELRPSALSVSSRPPLFLHMPGHQLGHLEHADLLLAVEDGLQILVSVDKGPLLCILKSVLADVAPEFFGQLGPGERFIADNLGQFLVRGDRFHEGGVGGAFCFFSCFRHGLLVPLRRGEGNIKIPEHGRSRSKKYRA